MTKTKKEEFKIDKMKCSECLRDLTDIELKDINKNLKKAIHESKKYKLPHEKDEDLVISFVCNDCLGKEECAKEIKTNKKGKKNKKTKEFKLDKTICSVCKGKLYEHELEKIRTYTDYPVEEDGFEPYSDEELEKYYVCNDCISDAMDCYGDGDTICMSGADDIFVSKRTAYLYFGM